MKSSLFLLNFLLVDVSPAVDVTAVTGNYAAASVSAVDGVTAIGWRPYCC
jgi:hypothetical protein